MTREADPLAEVKAALRLRGNEYRVLFNREEVEWLADELEDARTRLATAEGELVALELEHRRLLWASCAHPFHMRYGDDGELQCNGFDFRRESLTKCALHRLVASVKVEEAK